MENNIILFPAAITSLQTRADRSITVKLVTQELAPAKSAELFRLQNALVYVAVKEEEFGRDELEALEAAKADATEFGLKTDAQRLRAVLYLLWKHEPDGYKDSNSHYHARMEMLINQVKGRLP